jgi:hypothetical protein
MDANQEFLTEEQRKKGWTLSTMFGDVVLKFRGQVIVEQRTKTAGPNSASRLTKDQVWRWIAQYQQKYQKFVDAVQMFSSQARQSYVTSLQQIRYAANEAGIKNAVDAINRFDRDSANRWLEMGRELSDIYRNRP